MSFRKRKRPFSRKMVYTCNRCGWDVTYPKREKRIDYSHTCTRWEKGVWVTHYIDNVGAIFHTSTHGKKWNG